MGDLANITPAAFIFQVISFYSGMLPLNYALSTSMNEATLEKIKAS